MWKIVVANHSLLHPCAQNIDSDPIYQSLLGLLHWLWPCMQGDKLLISCWDSSELNLSLSPLSFFWLMTFPKQPRNQFQYAPWLSAHPLPHCCWSHHMWRDAHGSQIYFGVYGWSLQGFTESNLSIRSKTFLGISNSCLQWSIWQEHQTNWCIHSFEFCVTLIFTSLVMYTHSHLISSWIWTMGYRHWQQNASNWICWFTTQYDCWCPKRPCFHIIAIPTLDVSKLWSLRTQLISKNPYLVIWHIQQIHTQQSTKWRPFSALPLNSNNKASFFQLYITVSICSKRNNHLDKPTML